MRATSLLIWNFFFHLQQNFFEVLFCKLLKARKTSTLGRRLPGACRGALFLEFDELSEEVLPVGCLAHYEMSVKSALVVHSFVCNWAENRRCWWKGLFSCFLDCNTLVPKIAQLHVCLMRLILLRVLLLKGVTHHSRVVLLLLLHHRVQLPLVAIQVKVRPVTQPTADPTLLALVGRRCLSLLWVS